MFEKNQNQAILKPVGYSALIHKHKINIIPNWHTSWVTTSGIHRVTETDSGIEEIYPSKYWPGDTLGDHLEFALKYDGINLAILASIFKIVPSGDLLSYITSKPTGKYSRKIWFLYEYITGTNLKIADLNQGNYVDLLDPEQYYTLNRDVQVRRQRINDNLLGNRSFCPTVRKTEILKEFEKTDLSERSRNITSQYSAQVLKRALSYLYTKETKSSYEIEHIKPSTSRTERFMSQLHLAQKEDFCNKTRLIELQNSIVDPRFADSDYRTTQNYIGETISPQRERIHYVCPKPEDLPDLAAGLLLAHQQMNDNEIHSVIHAAVIAYGFVYLHPFEDGNGRIHRFLIHNILARRGFTPEGIMFPVSAAMLKNQGNYDNSLEAFSTPLSPLIEYTLNESGKMTVLNETATWYKYIDFTSQAEALFQFIKQTIDVELIEELTFLVNYDKAKTSIQEIIDMPDQKIDLFIKFCLQNNGTLSATKRSSHFELLSDDEISKMEEAVQSSYGNV
jgi:Fic family protein